MRLLARRIVTVTAGKEHSSFSTGSSTKVLEELKGMRYGAFTNKTSIS